MQGERPFTSLAGDRGPSAEDITDAQLVPSAGAEVVADLLHGDDGILCRLEGLGVAEILEVAGGRCESEGNQENQQTGEGTLLLLFVGEPGPFPFGGLLRVLISGRLSLEFGKDDAAGRTFVSVRLFEPTFWTSNDFRTPYSTNAV